MMGSQPFRVDSWVDWHRFTWDAINIITDFGYYDLKDLVMPRDAGSFHQILNHYDIR